jgi:hypothetical protein
MMTALEGYTSNGAVTIHQNGTQKGSFYVTPGGKSRLVVDEIYDNLGYTRSSVTEDFSLMPRSAGGADPCYVTETGDRQVIVRGTAMLQNGSYTVTLPAEAASKIRENTLTVQLTPRSAASKGLAVTDRQTGSFTVAELMSGNGSYAFDWTLTALRRDDPELRNKQLEAKGAEAAAGEKVELATPSTPQEMKLTPAPSAPKRPPLTKNEF